VLLTTCSKDKEKDIDIDVYVCACYLFYFKTNYPEFNPVRRKSPRFILKPNPLDYPGKKKPLDEEHTVAIPSVFHQQQGCVCCSFLISS